MARLNLHILSSFVALFKVFILGYKLDLMDLLLFCRKENSKKLEERLKKDDSVSGASIKIRDGIIVNKNGFYFYLEGTDDKIKRARELSKDLAEEILGEEKESVVKILKEEEERAMEGFGLVVG